MDFGGTYLLCAPREVVWQGLNDTSVLAKTIPGCQTITWRDANSLDLAVKVNLGLLHPTFTGELELSDIDPSHTYTLSGRAHGKLLGKANGTAKVTLRDDGSNTILEFTARGAASDKLLALGRPLIGKSVQRVIDHFFYRFAEAIGTEVSPVHTHADLG